ncbi:MAG: transcriptional regulator LasR [Oricola sp.]
MFRILVAPDFEITPADPDFPPALLETLKSARDATGSNYVSFWAEIANSEFVSRIILSTYPAAWLRRYSEQDYACIDPIIRKGMSSANAIIFDHVHPEDPGLAGFGADALEHEIGACTVGIPVHIGRDFRSVTSFATDMDISGDTDESSAVMTRFREQAHIVAAAVTERYLHVNQPRFNLTDREIEVLYWGSCGKTDQQIADLMGLSRWTVVAHVQSAKAKLGVNNKTAAIARALQLNLLDGFRPRS